MAGGIFGGISNILFGKPPKGDNLSLVAAEQAAASKELAEQQTRANRPNINTPYGSTSWTETAGEFGPEWTQNVTLDPKAQSALDAQQLATNRRSKLSADMAQGLRGDLGTRLDYDQFGEQTGLEYDPTELRNRSSDAAYESATSRLDPRFAQDEESMIAALRNQGLGAGDEAYDAAIGNFSRNKEDAYAQAERAAWLAGQGEAGQLFGQQERTADYANMLRRGDIGEAQTERTAPLNEMNALLSGQQIALPQMPDFNTASRGQTPQLLNASQGQFGQDTDRYSLRNQNTNSFLQGLSGL